MNTYKGGGGGISWQKLGYICC